MVPALCGIEVERAALNPWLVAPAGGVGGMGGGNAAGYKVAPLASPRGGGAADGGWGKGAGNAAGGGGPGPDPAGGPTTLAKGSHNQLSCDE